MFDTNGALPQARRLVIAGLAAVATLAGVLAAPGTASASPDAGSVTAPTITVSPLVASAPTNMTVGFTLSAAGALAAGQSAVLNVALSGVGSGYSGVLSQASTQVGSCVASTFPTVTCTLTSAVPAGAALKVALNDVINPTAGTHHVTIKTSADSTAVSTANYTISAAKSVSTPKVTVTFPSATEGNYTIAFSASAGGGLAKDLGSTVKVTLPAGTGLSTMSTSSKLTYRGVKVGTCKASSGTSVICAVTSTVANSSPLAVSLIDVTNPADGSYSLTVSTSSDTVTKTSSLYGVNAAITKPTVVVSPSTAAGALAHYKITFKLSASGGMQPGNTSFIAINFPAGVELGSLGTTTVTDAGVVVGSCPDAVEESPAQSLLCSFTSAVAGGDQLVIDLNGVINPAAGSQQLSMSTYADIKSVTSSSFTIVAAHKVTSPSAAISPTSAAGGLTSYTVGFTTSATGALAANADSALTLTFPASTGLTALAGSAITSGGSNVGDCASTTGTTTTVTCRLSGSVAASTPVTVQLDGVVNSTPAGSGSVSVSTTSDVLGSVATPTYTLTAPKSVLSPTVVPSPATPGTSSNYAVTFSTSSSGGLSAAAGSKIVLTFPSTINASAVAGGSLTDVSHGTVIGTCAGTSATQVVCSMTGSAAAGDQLTAAANGVVNPAQALYTLQVATTSDVTPVASAKFQIGLTPTLTLTTTGTAIPGSVVTATVSGFAHTSALTVVYSGNPIATTPASPKTTSTGTGTFTFVVPTCCFGSVAVNVTDASSNTAQAILPVQHFAPTLTAAPASGTPGDHLTCSGSGWPANETVNVYFGSANAYNPTTDSTGAFSGACTVQQVPITASTFTAHDSSSNSATGTFAFAAGIAPNSPTASTGNTVTITAQGFDANSPLTLKFGATTTTTVPASPVTNTNGTSTFSFTVPSTTTGAKTLTVTDAANVHATTTLTIYAPTLTATPASGTPGDHLTCSGAGWPPNEPVNIYFGTGTVGNAYNPTTDSTGAFSGACTVQQVPISIASFHAVDQRNSSATGTFAFAAGIAPNSPTASTGNTVTITAQGFDANSPLTLKFGATTTTTVPASPVTNTNGTSTFSFTVPSTTTGAKTLTVTDAANVHATTTLTIYAPTLTATPASGTPGDHLTCSGAGWPPNEPVNIYFGTGTVGNAYNPTTDSTGAFSGACTVQQVPISIASFHAVDQRNSSATGTFAFAAGIAPNSPTASTGNTVTITAQGFDANSPLTLKFGATTTTTVPASPVTNTNGTSTFSFTVPSTTTGAKTLTVTDAANVHATTTLTIYAPTLTATPASGTPGDHLTCSGAGWPPNEPVNIYFGTGTVGNAYNPTTDSTGAFSGACTVQQVPISIASFHAVDQRNSSATGTFAFAAGIAPNSPTASTGNTVTITAQGFDANSPLTLKFGATTTTTVPASPVTNTNGTSTFSFTVPSTTTGAKTLTVTDAANVHATTTLTIYAPTLTASVTSGAPGTHFTCSGSGWPPNEPVNVYLGTTNLVNPTTDATGAFTTTCTVPNLAPAGYAFTATDQRASTATGGTFTVT